MTVINIWYYHIPYPIESFESQFPPLGVEISPIVIGETFHKIFFDTTACRYNGGNHFVLTEETDGLPGASGYHIACIS